MTSKIITTFENPDNGRRVHIDNLSALTIAHICKAKASMIYGINVHGAAKRVRVDTLDLTVLSFTLLVRGMCGTSYYSLTTTNRKGQFSCVVQPYQNKDDYTLPCADEVGLVNHIVQVSAAEAQIYLEIHNALPSEF